ncbi:LemA family protein [Gordonia desulfuricans]|uniref:LemA family protein n=1 Tax=Gordonia desulfuricans TaxID=89051 RepID=A0A7K3LXB7_9ACTN|nr:MULTISPECIES: NUDIX hydrolase [Gordonia]NDK92571.1 LemA family protein [Gordonia desulfuricans]WLP92947.1 NUDIX hydrolase [Gordonia sp. NB41Y]
MIVIVVAVVVVALIVGGWLYGRANRLDRLNVRVDLARQSLESALDRRTVVVRAIAAWMATNGDPQARAAARELLTCADAAEHAPWEAREDVENALSAALARVEADSRPAALVGELADAETRVMMARRFYNDAVRDTLALADRFLVRALRLGGRSTRPHYFEIVERMTPGQGDAPE